MCPPHFPLYSTRDEVFFLFFLFDVEHVFFRSVRHFCSGQTKGKKRQELGLVIILGGKKDICMKKNERVPQ